MAAVEALQTNGAGVQPADAGIRDGDTVILDVNGEKQAFVTIKRNSKVRVGKHLCPLQPCIGQPFGSMFQVSLDTSELVRTKRQRTNEWSSVEEVDKDNSELLDAGAATQQLSTDDIAAMRAAGKTGEEIAAALAEGSATFLSKTQFSQAKYKKKKQKKYSIFATLQRPSARSICEAYFGKSAPRIQHLRADSLAMLLSLANIGAHAKVLVLETCSGLVTGAVAERLGGFGHVCSTHTGTKCPPLEATRMFNFSEDIKSSMSTAPLTTLLEYQRQATPPKLDTKESPASQPAQQLPNGRACEAQEQHIAELNSDCMRDVQNDLSEPPQQTVVEQLAGHPVPMTGERRKREENRQQREAAAAATAALLRSTCHTGFDCCIIAAPSNQPIGILRQLLPLLASSACFAIFSNWQQPLADCHMWLQHSKLAVNLQLTESWCRDYQVLPARTHPTMSMSGTGGYMLSGIKLTS